ncbi:DNA internalization-related competence protein ComEC/Rec2 [Mesobacillus boroniphilus]|uniref:DNA internalization-related competence protein ComEC/Rec2 n=1 Tax=Mesobacillus boroniphilus TaxID=308892 RepID=A0A944CM67_9BACI|nr:DNA internalization-related competence protein ComEC/Rec2 [Mesobacillus boroniphilus]MBS8264976.1 DNA internalization-related competence protein ComEC/Rec2 [Mesobacillus boroniphilus]
MMLNPLRPLKGQLFYLAAVSLLGLLTITENELIYGGLFVLGIALLKKLKKLPSSTLVIMAGCYLIFMAVGYSDSDRLETVYTGVEKNFLLLFDDEIHLDGDLLSAYTKAVPSNEKVVVKYKIKSNTEQQLIQTLLTPGMACSASGVLNSPSPARNPNAFDYKNYLQRNKISWILDVDKLSLETCYKQSDSIVTELKAFRHKEIARIRNTLSEETSALAAALIFGDRNLFNTETERSYQKIGIVHLLAISGLHVGLLTGMIYFICIRVGVTKEKTEILLMSFLPVYTVITGLSPPVVRSAVMLFMLIGSRRFALRMVPLDAVSAAFMIMAFLQPSFIFDTGFQLSFAVSFSLVISAPVILKDFTSFIKQTAAASFIAQVSSLPIILASFYEVSAISIFANLLFVPLFSIVLLPLLLISYIILLILGALPSIYLSFLENLVHHVNFLAIYLSKLPMSTIIIGKLEPFLLIVQMILIPLFFFKWEGFILKKSKPPLWLFAFPILPLIMQIVLPFINPYGQITFLDVGQGDSIFIRMPYNQGNYLIDTGGVLPFEKENWQQRGSAYDPGKKIVVPFLKSSGIRTVDKLILTHGDADHVGGAIALLEEIRVKQLIIPRVSDRSDLEQSIMNIANEEGIDIYLAGMGTGWKTAAGDFFILNPSEITGERNDQSIVLQAAIGGKKWLFTGDLGNEGENSIVRKIKDIDIDVLKVGHHGSKYSSSELFLERTNPDFAVISVGEKNRYGHPGKEVIRRLEERGTQIFRTDEDGAIIYKFKGNSGTFMTQFP